MDKNIDLTSLRLFVSACELQSLSKAARKEGVVASAVSKRITKLETLVGQSLFKKTKGVITPTEVGLLLLEHGRGLLHEAAKLVDRLDPASRHYSGTVVVGVTHGASVLLGKDVGFFLTLPDHRHIQVLIDDRDRSDLVQKVMSGELALGIVSNITDIKQLQFETYRSEYLCAVVPRSHPFSSRATLSYLDLLDQDQVMLPAARSVESGLYARGLIPRLATQVRAVVSTFDGAVRMARDGVGINVTYSSIANCQDLQGKATVVPMSDRFFSNGFRIIYRNKETLPAIARELLDHLVGAAKKDRGEPV